MELELHEQGSATMEESVLEGSVGIALLTTFPKYDELVYDLIQKENMVLLVNKACARRNGSGRELPSTSGRRRMRYSYAAVRAIRPGPFWMPSVPPGI